MFSVLLGVQQPAFVFKVEPGKGVTVEAGGVPILRGSYVQYYEPGWTKGYYSTNYGPNKVERVDASTVRVVFSSDDKQAHGTVTYHQDGNRLLVHYDCKWEGDHPVKIEAAAGFLWAPALEKGSLTADGKPTRALDSFAYSGRDMEPRRFSPDASTYDFAGPIAGVSIHSSAPLTLFDARGNYNDDWAAGHQYWWLGTLGADVAKDKPATMDVEYRIDVNAQPAASPLKATLTSTRTDQALMPDTSRPPLIPKPQVDQLNWDQPLVLTGAYSFPAGVFGHLDVYKNALLRRFVVPGVAKQAPQIAFDAGISRLGFVPGGYRIIIKKGSISVLGEEDEGLRNGLERVAAMAFASKGHICLPTGTLISQPTSDWRGVHLFVGKKALPFHEKLWNRVLLPLGFNKVVLQCERTAWDSIPGIAGSITMPKAELVKLFDFYRNGGVEPIPLVQSYGHMEWFFENGKNLDVAFNPEVPYAVDPRKPRTQELLTKMWAEIIETLKPKTIHFGLDEASMTGMHITPAEETQLWQQQLLFLGGIARTHSLKMMLWGDQGLAAGEATDATSAQTPEDAKLRRAAIPRGALIGDWHYANDPEPHSYTKSLQIWKDAGMVPIASSWYSPNNIKGFATDAGQLGCGTLQTTWCGYESSEEGMIDALPQFSAMILAADYSWSGRKELPGQLGYDPGQVFRKMYFGSPSPLNPLPGFELGGTPGSAFQVGRIHFGSPTDYQIGSLLTPEGAASLDFAVNAKGRQLAVALETLVQAADDGEPVAELTVTLADGKTIQKRLIYGSQVRAPSDKQGLPLADRNADGVCSLVIELGSTPATVRGISIKPLNRYTGLRVRGIEIVG